MYLIMGLLTGFTHRSLIGGPHWQIVFVLRTTWENSVPNFICSISPISHGKGRTW